MPAEALGRLADRLRAGRRGEPPVAERRCPRSLTPSTMGAVAGGGDPPEAANVVPPSGPDPGRAPTSAKSQVRGSSLLLIGRGVSLAVNFVAQVLIVRSLGEHDYGIFAYALSIADIGQTLATFGLDRTVAGSSRSTTSRGRSIASTGPSSSSPLPTLIGVAVVAVCGGRKGGRRADGRRSARSPADRHDRAAGADPGLDGVLTNLLSVYASPRAIFVRRFVLAPGLRRSWWGA